MYGGAVSVVVAAYNAEQYLAQCLESLAAQSLQDLQVIVVLDAPTDGTAAVAERYSDVRGFEIVALPENRGLSGARTVGLEHATGAYVGFVDADDWVAPPMYAAMVEQAWTEKAEIVAGGHVRVDLAGCHMATIPFPVSTPDLSALTLSHSNRMLWFACRNLYSRHMLDDAGVAFDPRLRTAEDSPFNLAAFGASVRSVVSPGAWYYYRENPTGLTMSKYVPRLAEYLQLSHDLKAESARRLDLPAVFFDDMRRYVAENLLGRLLSNALKAPDAEPVAAVREVLRLPMVREVVRHVPLTADLPRGQKRLLALAKARQARLIAAALGHE